jgi:nitrate reductase NapD
MNVSSAIIRVLPEYSEELKDQIIKSDLCDYHLHDSDKIIITIEGKDISEEISKLRQIEDFPHVISAEMVYSYSEYELEQERDKIEKAAPFPDWLNNENIEAGNIPYNGNLKKKY